MPLTSGTRLGPYEISEPIGKGGMGEVYRARDTKLERDVAIKVLPDELASDEERVARFEREAKLLASLNHPNIASIYGFESNALVLELVEGPTLAERIEKGPIPVDEAIAIAKQIAEALEAGHEAGVIHRDLKPANVKVREDGAVKVLDYGLAKALEGEAATTSTDSELSQSPTLTRQGTQVGVILGTAAYMSPEQAKGKRIDKRTDIWAFGAVLYEMLTGKRAFAGDNVSETLASVLMKEVDWTALPMGTPPWLQRLLRRCLEREPRQRLRDIGEARIQLDAPTETSAPRSSSSPRIAALAAALMVGGLIAGVATWRMSRPVDEPRPVVRFSLPMLPGLSASGTGGGRGVALSADGARLVYRANGQLFLHVFDQSITTPIRGSEGASGSLFVSPDGEWVGFSSNGELKKLSVRGGSPIRLCEAGLLYGASWTANDEILFGQRGIGFMRVSGNGGTPQIVLPVSEDEIGHGAQILPDGDHVLFTVGNDSHTWRDSRIVVESLETGARKILIEHGREARYLTTGHLVYVLDEAVFAAPFDANRLELTGSPVPVVEEVRMTRRTGGANYSVSETGSLVYGLPLVGANTLVWVDRDGSEEALAADPRAYFQPSISPDGSRVAIDIRDGDEDIWIWDFSRETLTQLTFSPGQDHSPVWTPDGKRVIYSSVREGAMDIYWRAADGTGSAELLHAGEHNFFPGDVAPDGKQLVFSENAGTQGAGLRSISLDGSTGATLPSELKGWRPQLSPDGRWLAYQSTDSARAEVHVRPFPNVEDGRWPISRGRGTSPRWAPDGTELFYIAPGAKLMAVEVETEPGFVAGRPELIASGYYYYGAALNYDISPDGKRFLMIKESEGDRAAFEVVIHWFSELERLVPVE